MMLSFRYAFSKTSGHRARTIRIIITSALSLTVMAIVLSIMTYLQASRFDSIREVRSFDCVVDGEVKSELEAMYPDYSIFQYAEGEALAGSSAYLVRYIGEDYDGGLRYLGGNGAGLSIPYSLYIAEKAAYKNVVMLGEGSSGRVVPQNKEYRITGIYATALGYEFDDTMLFLPYSEADSASDFKTAIKGISEEEIQDLRDAGYSVTTWKESESSLYSAFMIENVMMYVVLSLLFVIIAVSSKQSVRLFYRGKRKERFELYILGMERRRVQNIFLMSFAMVTALSILLAAVLIIILLPITERLTVYAIGIVTELAFPVGGFIAFSLFLILVTLLFTLYERFNDRKIDFLEVIHER